MILSMPFCPYHFVLEPLGALYISSYLTLFYPFIVQIHWLFLAVLPRERCLFNVSNFIENFFITGVGLGASLSGLSLRGSIQVLILHYFTLLLSRYIGYFWLFYLVNAVSSTSRILLKFFLSLELGWEHL